MTGAVERLKAESFGAPGDWRATEALDAMRGSAAAHVVFIWRGEASTVEARMAQRLLRVFIEEAALAAAPGKRVNAIVSAAAPLADIEAAQRLLDASPSITGLVIALD